MNINKSEAHEERANVITRLIDGLPLCKPFVRQKRKERDRKGGVVREQDWMEDMTALGYQECLQLFATILF